MVRYIAATLVALLVLTAGCSGVLPSTTDATEPTQPTEPVKPTDSGAPDGPTQLSEPAPGGGSATGATGPAVVGLPDVGRPTGATADVEVARAGVSQAFAPGTSYGAVQSVAPEGTISVSGAGQVSVDPDLAIVTVTVQAQAETAEAAREEVAQDAQRMRQALRELGIPDDDVRTTYYYLSPRYDYSRDRQELIGYVATHGFQIRSAVDLAGDVVDTAVGNGADQVSGVQFTLTDETRRDLRAEALSNAVLDARSDADAIALAAELTITGVHSASTSGPVVTPYVTGVAEAGGADARTPTTFDTGPVTVTAYVNIAYAVGQG